MKLIAKFCDLGLSYHQKGNKNQMSKYGTSALSSPELLPNLTKTTIKKMYNGMPQDIWALGLILYSISNGNLPPECEDLIKGT